MSDEAIPTRQPVPDARSAPPFQRRQLWLPLGTALVILIAVFVPQLTTRQDVINLLFLIFLYITLGQSWNILAGFAGQINLGHAAFFGIGALVTRTLWLEGLAFPLAFILGGLASLGFALLIGIPTFRLRGAYFSIGTLALAEVLRITVANTNPLITTLPTDAIATYDLSARYYLALAVACVTMLATYLLLRSRLSLGILAVREDESAAQATGVHTVRHKLFALAISSFFAGLAGATFAFQQVSYYPEAPFSPQWTFDPLLIAFVGGLGSQIGPVLGAIFYILIRDQLVVKLASLQDSILKVLNEGSNNAALLKLVLSLITAHQIIFGALFIFVVLALPGGLVDIWARLKGLISRR